MSDYKIDFTTRVILNFSTLKLFQKGPEGHAKIKPKCMLVSSIRVISSTPRYIYIMVNLWVIWFDDLAFLFFFLF
jgi:hypothetical protein